MEKSCGAVVYKIDNNEIKFLLVFQDDNKKYSFPKGHVEDNETEINTALREIKEETNLDVVIDSNFKQTITYTIKEKNVLKEVVMFIATPINDDIIPQEGEIASCDWYSYNEAYELLYYEEAKKLLEYSYNYIKDNN